MTTVDNPKKKGFFNRPRAGGKTIWNWLNLLAALAIPLVVVLATVGFGLSQAHLADLQHQSDQKIANQQHDIDRGHALDQQQATILQTYIDNIQDLLLNHNLLGSKPTNDVAILARARTLTALQGLDAHRKGILVQFLYEAKLIGYQDSKGKPQDPIITLLGADLTQTDLTRISLTGANLTGVTLDYAFLDGASLTDAILTGATLTDDTLTGATLTGTYLTGATLTDANLTGATLTGTYLTDATLTDAILTGANLTGAHLTDATLTNATLQGAILDRANLLGANVTQEQLKKAKSLQGATMPDGSKHP